MQTSLQVITSKARRESNYRFKNLYGLLNHRLLYDSWFKLNKKSAPGYDRLTAGDYSENLKENINNLVNVLKRKTYKARLVRRKDIPKANGQVRSLGIPTIEDKLLQKAAAQILEAIYENDFCNCSFGYRPQRGAKDAVQDISTTLQTESYAYIVDADIKGFFDTIDHEWLIKMLEQRIDDKAFTGLIRKWLKAGILTPEKNICHPANGTPQGGIISPILANIYLHYVLDLWFEKVVKKQSEGEAYLCRYADDFIVAFRFGRDADKFYTELKKRLEKFNLAIAEEKTKLIKFTRFRKESGASFDFLGFELRWGSSRKGKDVLFCKTSKKKLRNSLRNFKEWCKASRNFRMAKLFDLLNAKLRGYYNYYGVIGNYRRLNEFFTHAMRTLYKWLNRRSQRKSFNYTGFSALLKYYRIERPRITQVRNYQLQLKWS